MTKQNAITTYLPGEDEKIIELASKLVSLSKAAFCRTASIQWARNILKNEEVSEE